MYFRDVVGDALKGHFITRPEWLGYWGWSDVEQTFFMYCYDGRIMDIRSTNDVIFTLHNVTADDWIVIERGNYNEMITYLRDDNIFDVQDFCKVNLVYNPELNEYELDTPYGMQVCQKGDKILKHYTGKYYLIDINGVIKGKERMNIDGKSS